ncbi:MAG TPA: type II and III secretion system protein, partial [Tepidisphaeraceae bacterium]|nr:type II and III secretion system protein [Tepidisphaeraceae bacterium]
GINATSSSSANGLTSALTGQSNGLSPQQIVAGNAGSANDRGFIATSFGGSGLKLGVVKNNIAMFLEALETTADTVLLANPKVLVLNKQRGEVRVGSELGYRSQTLTADSTTAGSVEFLETGTSLMFRPFIAEDGFIRMEVLPEESTGTLVDDSGGKLPQKQTSKVITNILVKDGKTIVIGGLFRETNATSRGQVPGLGSAPLIGGLFRKQSDDTVREELIILLTPHIVKDHDMYSDLSKEDLARFNQVRVGVRRGMMFFGRERLAESSYDAAITEMNKPKPNRSRAIWFLNQATNLNPKFIEAIEMKQELTGKELRAVDNGIARDFVRDLVMRDVDAKNAPVAFEGQSMLDGATAKVTPNGLSTTPAKPEPTPVAPVPEVVAAVPVQTRRQIINPYAWIDLDFARSYLADSVDQPATNQNYVSLPND